MFNRLTHKVRLGVAMGILSGIKDRILRRNEPELEDFRSHVLGQSYEPPEPEPEPPKKIYEREPPPGMEPFGFEEPEPATAEVSKNYEIIDRLNIIEAQLSAIRSQTETINERLKNMELRLQRRY